MPLADDAPAGPEGAAIARAKDAESGRSGQTSTARARSAPRWERRGGAIRVGPSASAAGTDRRGDAVDLPLLSTADLLAAVAHELKTPVSSLSTTLEFLLSDHNLLSRQEKKGMLRRVQRGVTWLQTLVENLTSAMSLDTHQIRPRLEAIELVEAIEDAVQVVLPFLERKDQRIAITCPDPSPYVMADATRLCQVLVNLLVNASKYSVREDTIDIAVAPHADQIRIRITDHGPGIAPEDQARIFQRYVRGAGNEVGAGGLGLGLSIVKAIVDLHGGTIAVDSAPGQGAAFEFSLPAADKRTASRR